MTIKKRQRALSVVFNIIASMFVVCLGVYAATTIGTDITTTGTASSTSATTTEYMYVGDDITEPTHGFDFLGGDLIVSDDAFINGQATTSVSLWVGNAGLPTNIDMVDDLYVEGDAEIDGGLWVDSATTTDTTSIGEGVAIRQFDWGTCDIEDTAVTASSTAHTWCINATGVTSADSIFITATSSFDINYVIQTASSTEEAVDKISLRVLNLGFYVDGVAEAEGETLDGATLNWMSIR